MNVQEIKNISIKSYLASIGCRIETDRGYYGMYYAPYRKDVQASLKVDYEQNIWVDYSTSLGGSILDLVMTVEQCDFKTAIHKLRNSPFAISSFSFHCKNLTEDKPVMVLTTIKRLENRALLQYIEKRCIDMSIAQYYCKEAYYRVGNNNYFAVAFKNDHTTNNGYELRNKYCKNCTNKEITTIKNGSSKLNVFEGFMDMLSFVTYYGNTAMLSFDTIVLNGVTNIGKTISLLPLYTEVNLYLDNDEAGSRGMTQILEICKKAIDRRGLYTGYKDFNEFLIANREKK